MDDIEVKQAISELRHMLGNQQMVVNAIYESLDEIMDKLKDLEKKLDTLVDDK